MRLAKRAYCRQPCDPAGGAGCGAAESQVPGHARIGDGAGQIPVVGEGVVTPAEEGGIGQGGLAAMGLLGWRRKRKALNRMGVDQIDPSL